MRLALGVGPLLLSLLWGGAFDTLPDGSQVLDATVCDLLEHPLEYANRHVRVHATIISGPEYLGLDNRDCLPTADTYGQIWLDLSDDAPDIPKYNRGWSTEKFLQAGTSGQLHESAITWQTPVQVSPLDPKELKQLNRALQRSRGKGVKAVIVGRFDSAEGGLLVPSNRGGFSLIAAFGHLNCCAGRIVIEHLEVAAGMD